MYPISSWQQRILPSVMQWPTEKPMNNSAYIDGPCSATVGGVSPSSKAYTSDRSRRMVATGYSLNRAQPYTSCTSPTVGGLQTREHEVTRSDWNESTKLALFPGLPLIAFSSVSAARAYTSLALVFDTCSMQKQREKALVYHVIHSTDISSCLHMIVKTKLAFCTC